MTVYIMTFSLLMYHLSSKQWSIWFEGLLIAKLEKNRNTMVFSFWNVIWKAGCQKGWEFFTHLISLPQFSSSRGRKKLIGDVVHTPQGNIFAAFQVHLYFCSRGGLFQGIPVTLHVSGLKRPWGRGFLLLSSSGVWTLAANSYSSLWFWFSQQLCICFSA